MKARSKRGERGEKDTISNLGGKSIQERGTNTTILASCSRQMKKEIQKKNIKAGEKGK